MSSVRGDIEKLINRVAQSKPSNAGSSQKSNSSQSSGGSSSAGSIKGNDYYSDNRNVSSSEAIRNLMNSSIFDKSVGCYFDRMSNAVNKLTQNDSWRISMDVDGDGKVDEGETANLADAIASSFDSELDLYIQEEVNKVMAKYGSCSKSYLGEAALKELAAKGIRVDAVGDGEKMTNRAYAFSLMEIPADVKGDMEKAYEYLYNSEEGKNAKVLEDANGKKGSYIFADCLIPDGYAQGAEVNLSSILDQMGYDCISKADFLGREDEYEALIQAVGDNLDAGLYLASESTLNDVYGHTKNIIESVHNLWGGSGSAPGMNGISGGEKTPEELAQEEKELNEKQENYKKKLLEKAIEDYKAEHDGEAPTGADLIMLENEVDIKVNSGYYASSLQVGI